MLNFFKSFPLTQYRFDKNSNSKTIIVDVNRNVRAYLDQMDNANAYLLYEITDGSRPDQISMELYKTPAYYWTFFVVNENLSGGLHAWPKSSLELEKYIDEKYNRIAITSESKAGVDANTHLLWRYDLVIGETVQGLSSGATGTLAEIDYDTNTFYLENVTGNFIDESLAFTTSLIGLASNSSFKNNVVSEVNAVHHYINSDGVTIDRLNFNVNDSMLPVTNYEYETDLNDSRMSIRVINPAAIDEFATKYRTLINQ